jgi:hypothetical protein
MKDNNLEGNDQINNDVTVPTTKVVRKSKTFDDSGSDEPSQLKKLRTVDSNEGPTTPDGPGGAVVGPPSGIGLGLTNGNANASTIPGIGVKPPPPSQPGEPITSEDPRHSSQRFFRGQSVNNAGSSQVITFFGDKSNVEYTLQQWVQRFESFCDYSLQSPVEPPMDENGIPANYSAADKAFYKVLFSRPFVEQTIQDSDAWKNFRGLASGEDLIYKIWKEETLPQPASSSSSGPFPEDKGQLWIEKIPGPDDLDLIDVRVVLAIQYLSPASCLLFYEVTITDSAASAVMAVVLEDASYLLMDANLKNCGSCWLFAYPLLPKSPPLAINLTPVMGPQGYASYLTDDSVCRASQAPVGFQQKVPAMTRLAQRFLKLKLDQGPLLVPFNRSENCLINRLLRKERKMAQPKQTLRMVWPIQHQCRLRRSPTCR